MAFCALLCLLFLLFLLFLLLLICWLCLKHTIKLINIFTHLETDLHADLTPLIQWKTTFKPQLNHLFWTSWWVRLTCHRTRCVHNNYWLVFYQLHLNGRVGLKKRKLLLGKQIAWYLICYFQEDAVKQTWGRIYELRINGDLWPSCLNKALHSSMEPGGGMSCCVNAACEGGNMAKNAIKPNSKRKICCFLFKELQLKRFILQQENGSQKTKSTQEWLKIKMYVLSLCISPIMNL